MSKRERLTAICTFLLPAMVIYAVFFLYPIAQAFYISLFRWSGLSQNREFVGIDNFHRLFTDDPVFWMSMKHNLIFLVSSLILVIPLALFFAVVLARKVKGSGLYRAVYLFPNMISLVAVGVLWTFIYHPVFGILNAALKTVGVSGPNDGWLGSSATALPAVIIVNIWYSLGFYVILFLAGIQNIPISYYEAASLDGATQWQSFWHVTIPLLWEVLRLGIVYITINSMAVFGLVWVMTEGGPSNHTDTLLTYLYRQAFQDSNFGYATAIGVITFILIFILVLLSSRFMKRGEVQY